VRFRFNALAVAFAVLLAGAPGWPSGLVLADPISVPPANVTVAGTIAAADGRPIGGAKVELRGNGPAKVATSAADGTFYLTAVVPGTYTISATAHGYEPVGGRTVDVKSDGTTTLELALQRQQASSLTVIGSVRANGSQTISTAPAPTVDISTKAYAQEGETRTSDILSNQLSTTVYPIIGGGLNAPAVVALRGPDPSETLVDIDGHQVNNGNTGDFDLSLLDPADLQSVQVLYGIAPSSLFGPNTLGGAVNIRTLEPTTQPQFLERFTAGSYGTFGETLQATGTQDRLGYAFSIHRLTSAGELQNFEIPTSTFGSPAAPIGNDLDATSTIAKLRYSLGNGNGFVGFTFRDQAVQRDISATLSSFQAADPSSSTPATFQNFSGSAVDSTNRAYGVDLQLPLGRPGADGIVPTTLIFRHQSALTNQSVTGPGAGISPYLFNDSDSVLDDTLELDHTLPRGTLSLRYALTNEHLYTTFIPGIDFADADLREPANGTADQLLSSIRQVNDYAIPGIPGSTSQALAQTERSLGVRYAVDPTSKLHYTFATYFSNYSSFGRSIDPRFGFVWTPAAGSAFRASVGSTFQSPQLPTFITPPTLPAPEDGLINIGNPKATAEHATSYDLGYEHLLHAFALPVHLSADVYRTDLHNGVAQFLGTPANGGTSCTDATPCLTFPVNVTQEVYQGLEVRADVQLTAQSALQASYDIDSVYTQHYPTAAADNVPIGEQALGVPLHKVLLTYTRDPGLRGLAYYAGFQYEGTYNELNLGPFATLRAGFTYHMRTFDIGVYGTNLTNVYDFKLAQVNGGLLYGGLPANACQGCGPEPSIGFPLAGRQITLSIAHHM